MRGLRSCQGSLHCLGDCRGCYDALGELSLDRRPDRKAGLLIEEDESVADDQLCCGGRERETEREQATLVMLL